MIKRVLNSLYVHKSNINELFTILTEIEKLKVNAVINYMCINNKSFDIVKVNQSNGKVSLIVSTTWDILHEPIIDKSYTFTFDGINIVKISKQHCGTKVYHNKWSFVSDNYTGFNISDEKRRTLLLNSIPNIKSMKSRIGNKEFWYCLLNKYGIER